eukprot:351583-Chlamydomonas_euryale.AAC.5
MAAHGGATATAAMLHGVRWPVDEHVRQRPVAAAATPLAAPPDRADHGVGRRLLLPPRPSVGVMAPLWRACSILQGCCDPCCRMPLRGNQRPGRARVRLCRPRQRHPVIGSHAPEQGGSLCACTVTSMPCQRWPAPGTQRMPCPAAIFVPQ